MHRETFETIDQSLLRNNDEDWVDTVMACTLAVKKVFTRNTCRLCQVYSDKQVEFEQNLEQAAGAVERACRKTALPLHPEVELYKAFMFDEETVYSVVDSGTEVRDEDAETSTTQQTQ